MKTKDIQVIKTTKSFLSLLARLIPKAINVKQQQPERLELKGFNGTTVIVELLVPMDRLEPQAQKVIKLIDIRSVKS